MVTVLALSNRLICAERSIKNKLRNFTCQNHDKIIMRHDLVGELGINFDLLEFFNVHPMHGTTLAPVEMQPPRAGFDPATRD